MIDFSTIIGPMPGTLPEIAPGLSSNHTRKYIQEGTTGTAQTIKLMQELVARGKRDIQVREFVGKLLRGEVPGYPECTTKDYLCYAQTIYKYCRDEIKYVYDPHLVEYLEEPIVTLKQTKIADCDSICVLMGAMLEHAGLETQFVTIKADSNRPDEYSHVYSRVNVPRKGWFSIDATMPAKTFGWEAEGNYPKRYWPGSSDTANQPVDKSPSEEPPKMMSGLARLGRHGRHGGGHRGGGYGGGWGYGYPGYMAPTVLIVDGEPKTPEQLVAEEDEARKKGLRGLGRHGHGGGRGGGFGPGWGYGPGWFGPEVIVVQGGVPTTDEVSVLPVEDEFFAEPMSMLSGMSADEYSTTQLAWDVLNGVAYDRLRAMRTESQEMTGTLERQNQAIQKMSEPAKSQALVSWQKTKEAQLAHANNVFNAINKYNALVNWVQTYSANTIRPQSLGELGMAPAAIIGIMVAASVFLAFAAAFAATILSGGKAKGMIEQTSELIQNTGGTIEQTGNALLKVAFIAGIGLAAYMLYKRKAVGV